MTTRRIALWLAMGLLLGCRPPAVDRPNIVLIIGDDQAYSDAGFMGSRIARTPNLDRLAEEGTVLTTAYDTASVCRPSLFSLLTGLQPYQAHLWLSRLEPRHLARKTGPYIRYLETLPGLLASRGYRSFQAGKLWEGTSFDQSGFTAGTKTGAPGAGPAHPYAQLAGGEEGLEIGRTTLEPVWRFLDASAGQPFLLWLAPMLPHKPFDAPSEFRARYDGLDLSPAQLDYYANLSRLDDVVGAVLAKIDASGQRDRTLVVYLSDNGWDTSYPPGSAGKRADEAGGSGGKLSMHELGFRTPIVFRWPGHVRAGVVRDDLVSTLDLFPTLLDYAGARRPPGREGIDLRAALEDDAPLPARTLYGWMEHALSSKVGPGEAHWRDLQRGAFFARSPRWHYVRFPAVAARSKPAEVELYDLESDPGETRNLGALRPQQTAAFAQELQQWRLRMLATLPERPGQRGPWRDPAGLTP